LSTFYLEEGWYPSEHLAELLEANKRMNDHLAKALGEPREGEVHTIHKWGAEKKEWVGLTDEERDEIREQAHYEFDDISNAIEAKLKEKNNG